MRRKRGKKIIKEAYVIPVALSLFLVPIFWNPGFIYAFTQGKELLFKALVIIALFMGCLALIRTKKISIPPLQKSWIFIILLFQLSLYALTNALSITPLVTLFGTYSRGFGFIMEAFLFIFTLYCALTVSKQNISILLKSIFAGSFIISIYALIQKAGINPLFQNFATDIFEHRSFSFLGNPSYLGQFMLLSTIIGAYLTMTVKKNKEKILFGGGTMIFFLAIFLSETRTALVGLFIVVLLIVWKHHKKILGFVKKHISIPIIIALFIAITALVLPQERYSLSSLASRSLQSRAEIWNGALTLIQEKPLLGYGGETFYIYFPEIITKKFLTLEENININADRIHNETLELFFAHGAGAVILYIILSIIILRHFATTKNKTVELLTLIILANTAQNQFAFPDISISMLIAFSMGSIIALTQKGKKIAISLKNSWRMGIAMAMITLLILASYTTLYKPYMSHHSYTISHNNYNKSYEKAVLKHKEALQYTPYYSQLWYELMMLDPSSMERSLYSLEMIDGLSGNVLAWKGNFYSTSDPHKAAKYYIQALEKNPYHPNWLRAFADMLYEQGAHSDALILYSKYLNAVPDYWQWTEEIENMSTEEQKKYRIFFKNTPYFWGVIEKINNSLDSLNAPSTSDR